MQLWWILILTAMAALAAKLKKKKGESSDSILVLSSGLRISHIDASSASGRLIHGWAKELENAQGSVTHHEAVARERLIVSGVESGKFPMQAYHDYQRFAAGTGNVDSADLLMSFGVGASIAAIPKSHRLLSAARACDVAVFERLSASDDYAGALKMPAEDGTTPLIAAAFVGCLPILELILREDGVDVDGAGANGATALMVAAARGHAEAITLLVRAGASITSPHKFAGSTALHFAAEMNQASAVSTLCALLGATVTSGANAAIEGSPTMLNRDHRKAAVASYCNTRTTLGSSPLHTAAQKGASQATVLALVHDCGCEVDALLNDDTTPLYLAAQEGHVEATRGLIRAKAAVNFAMPLTAYKGSFHLARGRSRASVSGSGDVEAAGSFSDEAADMFSTQAVNSEAGNGATALAVAAENGHSEVLRVLLEEGGAMVNDRSVGTTALHLAVQYNRPACVQVLLSRPDIRVDEPALTDGSTALYGAAGRGRTSIVSMLLTAGASPLMIAPRGVALPLLYAVLSNQTRTAEVLLQFARDADADPAGVEVPSHPGSKAAGLKARAAVTTEGMLGTMLEAAGRDGTTALAAACALGLSEITSLLLQFGARKVCEGAASSSSSSSSSSASGQPGDPQSSLSSCLVLAVRSRSVDTLRALLAGRQTQAQAQAQTQAQAGVGAVAPSEDSSPLVLIEAIELNLAEAVELLLSNGWDPNRGLDDPRAGIRSHPLLLAVARGGRADIISILLAHGVGCNVLVARKASVGEDAADTLVDLAKQKRDFDSLQALMAQERCHPEFVRRRGGEGDEAGNGGLPG